MYRLERNATGRFVSLFGARQWELSLAPDRKLMSAFDSPLCDLPSIEDLERMMDGATHISQDSSRQHLEEATAECAARP